MNPLALEKSVAEYSTSTSPHQRRRIVLVVDDEDGVLNAFRQSLADLNCEVITTTDAHNAIRIITAQNLVDLLITDLFMPGMDGATLARRSRTIRPDLRVVFTTGVASDVQLRFWRAKGELIIPKPWMDQELIEAVEQAFRAEDQSD